MALLDLENMTSTFEDFVRIEALQGTEAERSSLKNAAFLIFQDVLRRFRTTLINPWGWRTDHQA